MVGAILEVVGWAALPLSLSPGNEGAGILASSRWRTTLWGKEGTPSEFIPRKGGMILEGLSLVYPCGAA